MTSMEPSIAAEHYNNKEQQITHVENGQQSDDERKSVEEDPLTYFTPAEQKKIIHRLDRRLVTVVGVMYCVSLMDRSNLSNAAIAGMNAELELTVGMRYVSICSRSELVLHRLRYIELTLRCDFDSRPSLSSSSLLTLCFNPRLLFSLARSVRATSSLAFVWLGVLL
jgi:hypothetical protein